MESAPDPDWFVRFLERTSTRPGERHPALRLLELRPGARCLDVGCGLGEDARVMSDLGASVVGVDLSRRMVAEARSRLAGGPGVALTAADARRLPFADRTFDAGWVKRTLMHLANPAEAVAELARCVRPGGRVVAVEPDLEVVLVDSGLVDVTRRLLAYRASGYASPWAGRQLRRLLLEAGLEEVSVMADHREFTDLADAEALTRLVEFARSAGTRGVLTTDEAARWEEDLRARDARSQFSCYMLWFVACGRVP